MNYQVSRTYIQVMADLIAPLCDGDEQLLQDMLEGETDLIRIVTRMHEMIARDNEMLAGIAERKAALIERERRIKTRAERFKAEIGGLLRSAQLGKIELPEVTYSVRDGKAKLTIVDDKAVPEQFQVPKYVPDKTAINEAFSEVEDLPNWLVREPANDIVTARTK